MVEGFRLDSKSFRALAKALQAGCPRWFRVSGFGGIKVGV